MGAWGVGSIEKDDAVDWLNDLKRSTSVGPIQTALDAVARLDPNQYLEAAEASAAVAAAEVWPHCVAIPAANLPSDVTVWVQAKHQQAGVADHLSNAARRAVARVHANSELRDLWEESDDRGAGWRQQLSDLRVRLAPSNGMAAILEPTERRRRDLIGDVAHELRTPIAPLEGVPGRPARRGRRAEPPDLGA